ncbi:MAG: adenosine deaminase [Bacteroidetes bacterium HGW-Bacteroidetes-20]|nr:MAG: adenosine deaminase [Bacteroidetes bacterium HGW-Bacteroidetes-20]
MDKNTLLSVLNVIPKVELHLHIEGTLEPELMFTLAQKNEVKIPYHSVDEVKNAYQFQNLQDFLDIYYAGANVLITEHDFFDLTWAYLQKAHSQHIVHVEIFFDPQTHTHRGIPFKNVVNGIHNALLKAEKELGITSHLIMCFLRHLSELDAIKTFQEALPFKNIIMGVGLDSSENGNPPQKFEKVFQMAKKEGFKTVAHAGEEGPAAYVYDAIHLLNVDRIDHGNNALDDPTVVEEIVKNEMALTVCPLSNLKLKVVPDLTKHPIKKMLDLGIKATINSDDPAYFGGYLNENYFAIIENLQLSKKEILTLIKNGFSASFMEEKIKNQWIAKVDSFA